MFAAFLALLESPAFDSAMVNAASALVAYFKGLPEKDRQAAIAALDAAATSAFGQVAAFQSASAADLATAQATLAQLEQHPAVVANESVAGIVANLKAQIAERVKPL